jgi:hypothetical protein
MLRSSIRLVLAQAELELPSSPFKIPPARRFPSSPSPPKDSLESQQEMSAVPHWSLASDNAAECDSFEDFSFAFGIAATDNPSVRTVAMVSFIFTLSRQIVINTGYVAVKVGTGD